MKNIYSLIIGNLKQMFVVSLGAAAILLITNTFLSLQRTEQQAAAFVINHVESLVEAGVNSQDVNGIDKEIGRFAKTWKDTQDLELRINVFLDEKKIGHAGQLQPYQHFYSSISKEDKLPSGHRLRVEIQLELVRFIFSSMLLLLVFEVSIWAVFYFLMRSLKSSIKRVTDPLESRIAGLKAIAQNLPESARNYKASAPTEIIEINELGQSIRSLTAEIADQYDRIVKITIDRERVRMAEHVAHNIKGIIATLQLNVDALPISRNEKVKLLGAADSLRDISSELLKSKKEEQQKTTKAPPQTPIHLLPVIQAVVASKKTQYFDKKNFHIEIENDGQAIGYFAKIASGDLQSILSNLIDNAVEAMSHAGQVKIAFRGKGEMIDIVVADTGKGIPPHVIPSLGQEGFFYGKPSGNGIGLFHAKTVMGAIGGSIRIESEEGAGSTITLSLPAAHAEKGLATAISVPANAKIICVDDDPLIHQAWDMRLATFNVGSIVHLLSVKEFEDWMRENKHGSFGSRLYLFDYDLKDEVKTGLCLIGDYGLALESILVSGLANDEAISTRAREMGVKRLSKDYLANVPIHVQEPAQIVM